MTDLVEDYKRECLERWTAQRTKRRKLAMELMDNRRPWNPKWPNWVVYDLRAEIKVIEEERRENERALAARDRRNRARADDD